MRNQDQVPGQLRPRRVTHNILIFLTSQVWDMIATFGATIILQKHFLTPEQFGHYAIVFSIVQVIVMLSFMGLQEVGVRELTGNLSPRERGICFGNLLLTRVVLLMAAGALLAGYLFMTDFPPEVVYGSILFYIALCIGSSAEVMMSAFLAAERFEFNLFTLFAERLTFLLGIIAAWQFDLGFLSIFWVVILSKVVKALFSIHYMRTHLFEILFQPSLSWIIKTLKESSLIGLGISLGLGLSFVVNLILETGNDLAQVGFFYAFLAPILRAQMLSSSVSQGLMPRISREAKADSPLYFKLVRKGIWSLFLLGCVGIVVGYLFRALIVGLLCHKNALAYLPAFAYLLFVLPTLFIDNVLNAAFISRRLAREFFCAKGLGLVLGAAIAWNWVSVSGIYAGVAGFVIGKWVSTLAMLVILHIYAKNWGKGQPAPPLQPFQPGAAGPGPGPQADLL